MHLRGTHFRYIFQSMPSTSYWGDVATLKFKWGRMWMKHWVKEHNIIFLVISHFINSLQQLLRKCIYKIVHYKRLFQLLTTETYLNFSSLSNYKQVSVVSYPNIHTEKWVSVFVTCNDQPLVDIIRRITPCCST